MALPVQEMFNRGALISLCFTSSRFLSTYHVLGINREVSKDGPWPQVVLSALKEGGSLMTELDIYTVFLDQSCLFQQGRMSLQMLACISPG